MVSRPPLISPTRWAKRSAPVCSTGSLGGQVVTIFHLNFFSPVMISGATAGFVGSSGLLHPANTAAAAAPPTAAFFRNDLLSMDCLLSC